MKILITGGAGFIGSHVTKLLCDKGHDVTVIDDLRFGFASFVDKRAKFIKGSLENKSILDNAIKGSNLVVHLAASSIIKFSFEKPIDYFQNNLMNGIFLLEAMKKNGVKKIIY